MNRLVGTLWQMARRAYTDDERAAALELYVEHGAAETARRTGIPDGTLQSWAHRAGLKSVATETTAVAVEAAMVSLAERKATLASDLLADAQKLRAQLFAPTTTRKPMTVSDGAHLGSHVEVVDVDLDQPTFAEQTRIMTSIAIAIDKVQILTGQATEITEHRHVDQVDAELQRLTAELAVVDPVDA